MYYYIYTLAAFHLNKTYLPSHNEYFEFGYLSVWWMEGFVLIFLLSFHFLSSVSSYNYFVTNIWILSNADQCVLFIVHVSSIKSGQNLSRDNKFQYWNLFVPESHHLLVYRHPLYFMVFRDTFPFIQELTRTRV